MVLTLIAVITGYILELIFGNPNWIYHPIRFIGGLITKVEKLILKLDARTDNKKFYHGIILTIIVCAISFAIPAVILFIANKISPYVRFTIETFMCFQIFATKCLADEGIKVFKELKVDNLVNARKQLSYLVSRDTTNLTSEQVTNGTVETIAENTTDGVMAPLFYLILGGASVGFLYKSINTLDSMIGYKNDKYMFLGRFAAKLDDVANFIPARISAWLIIFATFLAKYDVKNAIKIYKRDKYNHTSPNAGHTESAFAGALNIQLGGNNIYFGRVVNKPTIGDPNRKIEPNDILRAVKLLYITSSLGVLSATILYLLTI